VIDIQRNTQDPKQLVVDPSSVELVADDTVRPGGTSCRVSATFDANAQKKLTLTLQEFPDSEGELVYFKLSDPSVAAKDELAQRILL
jgi:hypothetical protein